jgi:PucR C-terminal helix-turn-helix domain
MRALLQRLSGLDDVAESAVRIIELFDKLAQQRLSVHELVGSAAMFSECSVGVANAGGEVIVRVTSDGRPLEPYRPDSAVTHPVDGGGEVWLEREGPPPALDGLVLERFATAVAISRKRERAAAPGAGRASLVEVMIRRAADDGDRNRAIQLFGLVPESPIRVLAVAPCTAEIPSGCPRPLGKAVAEQLLALVVHGDENLRSCMREATAGARIGVGPSVPAAEAWRSWHAARLAVRFADDGNGPAASGSPPDTSVVFWDDLGGLTALAEYVPPDAVSEIPDVAALDRLAAERTGTVMLAALRALCETESIRVAARALHMHHSSVGQRLDHAEQVLGFSVRTALGRNRLAIALALRRLRETAPEPSPQLEAPVTRNSRQLAGRGPEIPAVRH